MSTGWSQATGIRVYLEADTPEKVAMTPSIPQYMLPEMNHFRASMEELSPCNIMPYVYFRIFPQGRGRKKDPLLEVMVLPRVNPQYPGRYLDKKPVRIIVQITRPNARSPLRLTLGVQNDLEDFRIHQTLQLSRYTKGEEQQWGIEILFQRFYFPGQ